MPWNQKFGSQENDEIRFFRSAKIGEVFTTSEVFGAKEVQALAAKAGFDVEYCQPRSREYVHGPCTYKIIGKQMQFEKLERNTTIVYTFDVQTFDKFVYISIIAEHQDSVKVDEDIRLHKKQTHSELCLPKKIFDKLVKEHGKDPSWVINFWQSEGEEENIIAVVQKRLDMYLEGKDNDYQGKEQPSNILELLKTKQFSLLVNDKGKWDGFLYDVDGVPLFRWFRITYANGHLTEAEYELEPLMEHLKDCKTVLEPKIITIPKYSATIPNEQAVEFAYVPPNVDIFLALAKANNVSRYKAIKMTLEVDKFKRKAKN